MRRTSFACGQGGPPRSIGGLRHRQIVVEWLAAAPRASRMRENTVAETACDAMAAKPSAAGPHAGAASPRLDARDKPASLAHDARENARSGHVGARYLHINPSVQFSVIEYCKQFAASNNVFGHHQSPIIANCFVISYRRAENGGRARAHHDGRRCGRVVRAIAREPPGDVPGCGAGDRGLVSVCVRQSRRESSLTRALARLHSRHCSRGRRLRAHAMPAKPRHDPFVAR